MAEVAAEAIGSRFDQKNVHLVMRDAGRIWMCGVPLIDGPRRRPLEFAQVGKIAYPHRQINIVAFVPDFDTGSAQTTKTWHFLLEWRGHRAEQHNFAHVWNLRECRSDCRCGLVEGLPAFEHRLVLLLDLAVGNGPVPFQFLHLVGERFRIQFIILQPVPQPLLRLAHDIARRLVRLRDLRRQSRFRRNASPFRWLRVTLWLLVAETLAIQGPYPSFYRLLPRVAFCGDVSDSSAAPYF